MPKHNKPAPFRCSMSMEDTTATITMEGEIGFEASPIAFCDQVDAAVSAGATALIIRINSPGGICYDGLAMGEKLRTCGLPTTGIVIGSAMSMAGYLLQCCDKRIALATSTIMVHQPSAGLYGPVDELLSAAQYFVRMRDDMFALMGERCGMSGADFSALHASMKFYTAAEALALGLVDEISGSEADAVPAAAPEPEQPASALGTPMPCAGANVRMLDPRHMAAAFTMAADEEEEPSTEETAEEAAEEAAEEQAAETAVEEVPAEAEPAEEEPATEEAAEEQSEEPAEEPAEEVSEEEDEEEPAEVMPEPAPVPAPAKEPQAYITREEHLAALRQQEARIFARLGVPASSLPAPVATEGGHMPTPAAAPAATYTRAQLDAMPAMRRLQVLNAAPELKHSYLTGSLS